MRASVSRTRDTKAAAPLAARDERALDSWLRRATRPPLEFAFAELTAAENEEWARRISKLRGECGCAWGARALALVAVVFPAVVYLGGLHVRGRLWLEILTGLMVVFAASLAGKAISLLRARRQLRGSLDGLSTLLRERRRALAIFSS